jgi:excisionase family DNA binding protein
MEFRKLRPGQLATAARAARLLNVKQRTIYQWIQRGKITETNGLRYLPGGGIRIYLPELRALEMSSKRVTIHP